MSPAVAAIDIDANRRLLNRYRYVQHEMMHIFAGWMPRIALFEMKCEAGRTIWENSLLCSISEWLERKLTVLR